MLNGINYVINHVLMCMRPEMAREFGFTKWNRCRVVVVNSNPRVFTVHVNSVHEINFVRKMWLVE